MTTVKKNFAPGQENEEKSFDDNDIKDTFSEESNRVEEGEEPSEDALEEEEDSFNEEEEDTDAE